MFQLVGSSMFGIKPSIQCFCFALWDKHNRLLRPQAGSVGTVLDDSGSYTNYVMIGRLEGAAKHHSQFVTERELVLYMCVCTGWRHLFCFGMLIHTSCL